MTKKKKYNIFTERLQRGLNGEKRLAKGLEKFNIIESVKRVIYNQEPEIQKSGVDRIDRFREAKHEQKTREYDAYKWGDILIETVSVIEANKLGWWYTSEADIIDYVWRDQTGKAFIDGYYIFIRNKKLREWFEETRYKEKGKIEVKCNKCKKVFQTLPSKFPIKIAESNGCLWHTENIAIPIRDFPKGTIERFKPRTVEPSQTPLNSPIFAFNRSVLETLNKDAEWSSKLSKAKTWKEVENVLIEFSKSKGFRVGIVSLEESKEFFANEHGE